MKKNIVQKVVFGALAFISLLTVVGVISFIGFIVVRGLPKLSWEFISKAPTNGMMEGGIFPAIIGTVILIIGSCLVAFPVGILSGIYMNEYAPKNIFKKFIGMMTNNLAGIPSVVFGLFGLAVFVNFFGFGISIISGSLTLGIMILPIIIRTTEESLKQVDDNIRLASYALGANKLETIFRVILPVAIPNIITGLILSIGRVAGETAPIIFTVAAYYLPEIVLDLNAPVMALPYHLYVMATSGVDLNASRNIAFGTALVLLIIVFTLNMIANLVRSRALRNH